MKEELNKLRSPELSIAGFCESVKDLQSEEIFEAILLEMLEVNRLYAVVNKHEKMEDGLPTRNTPARNYYNALTSLLSLFGNSPRSDFDESFFSGCQTLIGKLHQSPPRPKFSD